MRKTAKNLISVCSILFAGLALTALVTVAAGYRPFILMSASMEPLYPKGSLVWVNTRVALDDVAIGDVLVYRTPSSGLVLHRMVGEGLMQGDANELPQEVDLSNVNYVGRAAFTIPFLGDAISVALSARWVVWLFAGLIIVLACIPIKLYTREQKL